MNSRRAKSPRCSPLGSVFFAALALAQIAPAQIDPRTVFELSPFTVTPEEERAPALANTLSPAPAASPDLKATLDADTRFSAFRDTRSYAAHPTTQGIRLRNLGANASSRALVLLDGVPQNDPFGGWIYWHPFNLAQIDRVEVNASGGGEAWGNLGSGGVISIVSKNPAPPYARVSVAAGSASTYSANASASQQLADGLVFDLGGRYFDTDGFYALRSDQRGPIDKKAFSQSESLQARLRWSSRDWSAQLSGAAFRDERGNGTPLARNETEGRDFAFVAERRLAARGSSVNATLYFQDRAFPNVFSSVAEDRASEQPALDQYDVPAEAFGAAVSYRVAYSDDEYLLAGIDYRRATGSVNESFRNMGGGFTRDRHAGGRQDFAGAFATLAKAVGARDLLTFTARVDRVENSEGVRIERDTVNDLVLIDERYADRSDSAPSGSARWRHSFSDTLASYATLFSGFRAPTLNELYRPFRVRNDITEANPQLSNERHHGIELALAARAADGSWEARAAAFHYRVEDVIANALLTTEPGFDPLFGFIPAGGSGSRRENLDRSHVSGAEIRASWQAGERATFAVEATYTETEVDRDAALPGFEGNAFPQSPQLRANARVDWQASEALRLTARAVWIGESYENLENSLSFGGDAAAVDLVASYQLTPNASLGLAIQNAFDETLETGISSDGLVTIDAPRTATLSVDWTF